MNRNIPGLPVHHQLPESTQTHVHRVGDAIQPSYSLFSLLLPPSIFPSIRVFSNESVLCIRWPKDWRFSLNISPSNEHLGLISFRMDWLDLLAVQGTLKSLLWHHRGGFTVRRRIVQKCSVEHNLVDRSRSHWQCLGVNLRVISGWFPVSLPLVQVPRASCLTPVKNSGSEVSFTADTLVHAWPS